MKKLMIILLLTMSITTAHADETSHNKAAEDLLKALEVDVMMNSMIDNMFGAELRALESQLECITPSVTIEVVGSIKPIFQMYEDNKEQFLKLYTDVFTEAELKEVADFYNTGVGKKFVKNQAILMQKGSAIGEQYGASKQAQIQQVVGSILGKYVDDKGVCK